MRDMVGEKVRYTMVIVLVMREQDDGENDLVWTVAGNGY